MNIQQQHLAARNSIYWLAERATVWGRTKLQRI